MAFSAGMILLLVLFILFLILTAVFIGLYVLKRNEAAQCQNNLKRIPTSYPCPPCPQVPDISIPKGEIFPFVTGTAKGENVDLTCPVGQVITRTDVLTRVIDSGGKVCSDPTSLNSYVNAIGQQSYSICPSELLNNAGIDYQHSACGNFYPTQAIYGYYTCGPGKVTTQNISNYGENTGNVRAQVENRNGKTRVKKWRAV